MSTRRGGPAGSWSELSRLQERLNELLEQALVGMREGVGEGRVGTWSPAVDLVETTEGFVLFAELAGVSRDDIDLRIDGRRLDLSGERRPVDGDRSFLRLERHYGPFRRRVELPADVDGDRIDARVRKGVLEVRLPKKGALETRQVEIGGG